jgi:hypothetical protein
MSASSKIHPDGVVAFVKRGCPTCTLIEAEMQRVSREVKNFQVVSQDDPDYPSSVASVVDDRELDLSWQHSIESTPTLVRFKDGAEVERVVAWDRDGWRRLTGIADLGKDLPTFRPG